MKVVSWNIELGKETDAAITAFRSLAALQQPDIVLLQEMSAQSAAEIADALAMGHRFAAAAPHRKTGRPFGNAVLSPWPLRDETEIELASTARVLGQPRSALRCIADIDGLAVVAVSAHTEIPLLSLRQRRRQFRQIAVGASIADGAAVIVGGDFNVPTPWGERALVRDMAAAGLSIGALDSAPTLRRFGVPMRLDYLFVSGLTCVRSGVSQDPTASDHQPVWAEFVSR